MPAKTISTAVPAMTDARRRLVLGCCSLSMLVVVLDVTALAVALPTIQRDLHMSVPGLQWVLAAYALVLASLQILAGSLGDRLGHRRMFQAGLLVFALGSVCCALATGGEWLIASRVLQGFGGAVLNPVSLAIISHAYPDKAQRAKAIGVWSTVGGAALAAGPLVGGLLVGLAGWRSVFWMSTVIALCACALTTRYVAPSPASPPRRADLVGQVLVIVFLASLTYAIVEAPAHGWTSAQTLGCLVLAVCAVTGLIAYERQRTEPLIDLRFFRSAPFSMASVAAVCAMVACCGFLFLSTLYLQDARGLSALNTGLWTLPMAGMTLFFTPLSGRLTARYGSRTPLVLAGAATVLGGLVFTLFHAEATSVTALFVGFVLLGIGYSMVATPVTHLVVSGMPRERAGVAGAIVMTSRLAGQALGFAVSGAVVAGSLHAGVHTSAAAFAAASQPAWWIICGCGGAVLVLGALAGTRWARRTASSTATLLTPPDAARGSRIGA